MFNLDLSKNTIISTIENNIKLLANKFADNLEQISEKFWKKFAEIFQLDKESLKKFQTNLDNLHSKINANIYTVDECMHAIVAYSRILQRLENATPQPRIDVNPADFNRIMFCFAYVVGEENYIRINQFSLKSLLRYFDEEDEFVPKIVQNCFKTAVKLCEKISNIIKILDNIFVSRYNLNKDPPFY